MAQHTTARDCPVQPLDLDPSTLRDKLEHFQVEMTEHLEQLERASLIPLLDLKRNHPATFRRFEVTLDTLILDAIEHVQSRAEILEQQLSPSLPAPTEPRSNIVQFPVGAPPVEPESRQGAYPTVELPWYFAGRELVAFEVAGDALAPDISEGDIAIIDPAEKDLRSGDILAVELPGGLRMLGKLRRRNGRAVLVDNHRRQHQWDLEGAQLLGLVVHVVTSRQICERRAER